MYELKVSVKNGNDMNHVKAAIVYAVRLMIGSAMYAMHALVCFIFGFC